MPGTNSLCEMLSHECYKSMISVFKRSLSKTSFASGFENCVTSMWHCTNEFLHKDAKKSRSLCRCIILHVTCVLHKEASFRKLWDAFRWMLQIDLNCMEMRSWTRMTGYVVSTSCHANDSLVRQDTTKLVSLVIIRAHMRSMTTCWDAVWGWKSIRVC